MITLLFAIALLLFAVPGFSQVKPASMDEILKDCILWIDFNEGGTGATNFEDWSPKNKNVNSITAGYVKTTGTGLDGTGAILGTQNVVNAGVFTPLPTTSRTNISIGALFKTPASVSSSRMVIAYNGNPSADGFGLWINDGSCNGGTKMWAACGGLTCGLIDGGTLSANTWYFFLLTANADANPTWTLYKNGAVVGTPTARIANTPTTFGAFLRNGNGSFQYAYTLDTVFVINRWLTTEEVKELNEYIRHR